MQSNLHKTAWRYKGTWTKTENKTVGNVKENVYLRYFTASLQVNTDRSSGTEIPAVRCVIVFKLC
jgi:hypothetical protein